MTYHDDLDRRLCHIENQFDFLYYITPSNHAQSWQAFKANGFHAAPQIQYRPKPSLRPLKEELKKLAQESHSTSALHQIYRSKIHETSQMIALVEAMGQPEFRHLSIQLFGQPDTELLHVAKRILQNVDAKVNHQQNVDALRLKNVFDQQITEYRRYIRPSPLRSLFATTLTACLFHARNSMLVLALKHQCNARTRFVRTK